MRRRDLFSVVLGRALRVERLAGGIKKSCDMAERLGIEEGLYRMVEYGGCLLPTPYAIRFVHSLGQDRVSAQKFFIAHYTVQALRQLGKTNDPLARERYLRELIEIFPDIGTVFWRMAPFLSQPQKCERELTELIESRGAHLQLCSYWRPDPDVIRAPAFLLPGEQRKEKTYL